MSILRILVGTILSRGKIEKILLLRLIIRSRCSICCSSASVLSEPAKENGSRGEGFNQEIFPND